MKGSLQLDEEDPGLSRYPIASLCLSINLSIEWQLNGRRITGANNYTQGMGR
jgi:hypothetical protein